jgi:transcriptional regulator with XRE-family HTH domain
MELEKFGKFVQKIREQRNLTQKQLGDILNITDKAVSRWERGECYPEITILPNLANCFGITIDELLSCDNSNIEPKKKMQNKLLWFCQVFSTGLFILMSGFYLVYNAITNGWADWVFPIILGTVYVGVVVYATVIFDFYLRYIKKQKSGK